MSGAARAVLPAGVRPASADELAMRASVEAFLRQERPHGHIIHELQVGGCRADIALVEAKRLTLFELKSARDTMERAAQQMKTFRASAHHAVLVADIKFFDLTPYNSGDPRCAFPNESYGLGYGSDVWVYPQPPQNPTYGQGALYQWTFPADEFTRPPHPLFLLELLVRAELEHEAKSHGVPLRSRMRNPDIVRAMIWHMTGGQVVEAVCRQLASRAARTALTDQERS